MPNAEHALVTQAKITEYLLSPTHPDAKGKAAFFTAFGYSLDSWNDLADALRRHAVEHEVVKRVSTVYGMKYIIEGALPSPDGRAPTVRSVWFLGEGTPVPRLVTAYPA